MSHCLGVHIHAIFEDFLNTSAVSHKTYFEQKGCYIKISAVWAKINCQDIWALDLSWLP